jgi:rod shape-determining protein MreD
MSVADAAKALVLLLVVGLLQVTIVSSIEVASGHADLVLVVLVSIALLRGPIIGASAGFWAGLVVDFAALAAVGLSSLLLTLVGYGAGRFGQAASKSSPHPPIVAVAVATVGATLGSGLLHFMLGQSAPAGELLGGVLLPALALNVLLAYPVHRLNRRLFAQPEREAREAVLV